jgi:hypothetical protein
MAALATQVIALPSTLPTFAAAAGGGDTAIPGSDTFLVVKNGGGSSITVTLDVPGTDAFGNNNPDLVVTVVNATERYIPLRSAALVQPSTGLVNITYSAVTSVTVGVFTPST